LSYIVLARKYRPLRFADMVGQEHIGRTLGNAIVQDRVHHAYLFTGARGLGKTTTARIFAKALVCEKGPAPEPCNACEQCLAVTEGRSVDVLEIDGASNSSVENIRNLREQVHYLPQTARRKIYIIDEVHMLTTHAFNALLKTLEEPPAHVSFVFATTEPHKVIPTIMSRVSRMEFRRVSIAETVAHLENILRREGLGVDAGGLRLVAKAAGGSVRDAMTMLDQVLAFANDAHAVTEAEARAVLGQADRTAVAGLVDALLARDPDLVLARFDALSAAGHDLTVLALQMLEDLRDLTVARACRNRELFVDATADELEELTRRAGVVDVATLAQSFDRLWRVIDRLPLARSPRLVLEMGLLGLAQREPLVPLGDLVERLQALSEATPEGGGGADPSARGQGARSPAPKSAPRSDRRAAPEDAVPTFAAPRHEPEPEPTRSPVESRVESRVEPRVEPRTPATPPPDDSPFARSLWALASGAVGRGDDGERDEVPPPDDEPQSQRPAKPTNGTPRAPSTNGVVHEPPTVATPIVTRGEPEIDLLATLEADDVTDVESFAAWTRLVAAVRDRDESASAQLRSAGLVRFADGVLVLAAPRGSFEHTRLVTGDLRAHVEQAAKELFEAPVSIELTDGKASLPDCPSLDLVDRRRRARLEASVAEEARDNPTIVALLRDFDAKLATTRPVRD